MPVDSKLHVAGDPSDLGPEQTTRRSGELQGHLGVGDIRRNSSGVPTSVGADLLGTDTTNTIALGSAPALATGAGAAGTFTVTYTLPSGATALEVVVRDNTTKKMFGKGDAGASAWTSTIAGVPTGTLVEVETAGVDASGRKGPGTIQTVTTHA